MDITVDLIKFWQINYLVISKDIPRVGLLRIREEDNVPFTNKPLFYNQMIIIAKVDSDLFIHDRSYPTNV